VLTVTVTDSGSPGQSDTATVTIDVTDANEFAPVALDAAFSLAENASNGTLLGAVAASDADGSQTLSYAITAGDPTGIFAIHAASGQITLADGSQLDHETLAQHVLTVTVTDSGSPALAGTATVTIDVTDVNEFSPVALDATFSVAEDASNGTPLGAVSASDADSSQTLSYAITAGNTGGVFAIDAVSGALTVADASQLDYDSVSQYLLTVRVTDSGSPARSGTAAVTIDVTDVNLSTPLVLDAAMSVLQGTANGTQVGVVTASDGDASETLSYAITGGDPTGVFAIDAATGAIRVADGAQLNPALTPQYVLTVTVTDSGVPARSATATATVTVTPANPGALPQTPEEEPAPAPAAEPDPAASSQDRGSDPQTEPSGRVQVIAVELLDERPSEFQFAARLSSLVEALSSAGSPRIEQAIDARLQAEQLEPDLLFDPMMWEVLQNTLDSVHEDLEREAPIVAESAVLRSAALAITAGTLSWLMRASSLMTSLMISLPAWMRFDPLPILQRDDEDAEEDEFERWHEDRQLEDLFEERAD
jgi:hypothetical protein